LRERRVLFEIVIHEYVYFGYLIVYARHRVVLL